MLYQSFFYPSESEGFPARHVCAAKTYSRSCSPICPWVKAEHSSRQQLVSCVQHCRSHIATPYRYGDQSEMSQRLAGATFRMVVPVSPAQLCFVFVKNEHYVTGVVADEESTRLLGYLHLYLDPTYIPHIWHGSVSRDHTHFAMLVKDVTNRPGCYNLHLFEADSMENNIASYNHVKLIQNLTCFLNGGMKTMLIGPTDGIMSCILVPVLEDRKIRAVCSDFNNPSKRKVSRDLNEYLALGNIVTSDWSIQNLVTSLDDNLLFVCIEELCINRRTDAREKRGRVIIFNVKTMDTLCSLSTHLHTDYWWNLETFGCFSNVTPSISQSGYKMALYTQMSTSCELYDGDGQSPEYILMYGLPLVTVNLKWACRKVILEHVKPKDIDELHLPSKLKEFLHFIS